MVLQKRLDYGFNGYQVPVIPRAPRSARRRSSIKKKIEENPMCAFDLLATIAGKLLVEGDIPQPIEKEIEKEKESENKGYCKDSPLPQNDACSGHASVITTDNAEKLVSVVNTKKENGYGNTNSCKLEDETAKIIKTEEIKIENVSTGTGDDNMYSSKAPLCNLPLYGDNVKVISRDDDEISCTRTHLRATVKSFKPTSRIEDRRKKKFMAFHQYRKVFPRLKDGNLYNTNGVMKPMYRTRKTCNMHQRSQKNYHLKKLRSNHSRGISCSLGKATGPSSSAVGQNTSFRSRESHVKLRIKSFRVPELFIEIPETATVGSLKRRVMEAVNAILGGGLRVGVLLQGKNVKDDNKTLLQYGISHENKLDALGFALEPNKPCLLPIDSPKPLTRLLSSAAETHHSNSDHIMIDQSMSSLVNFVESDHDSAPSPSHMSVVEKVNTTDSNKAIIPVPAAMSVEALAMVPMHRKSKPSDSAQRRIRRPFSVYEVEALVQAVEKLGTGRWRDVKLRAFDNAKHRTYVDLKDKWKTLVHTARISPQQRRGEPVPQELLDRVLTAHAYWTQQQLKNQAESSTCLVF